MKPSNSKRRIKEYLIEYPDNPVNLMEGPRTSLWVQTFSSPKIQHWALFLMVLLKVQEEVLMNNLR